MFKRDPSYTPVNPAELDDWPDDTEAQRQLDPESTPESRNHPINIHRRPGFFRKALLISVLLNALFLMVVGWQYMKIRGLQMTAATGSG